MDIKNKKEIIKELQKSGFPLEVAVLNILNSFIMSAYPSDSYFDSKMNKIREIDIHALDFYPTEADVFLKRMGKNQKRIIIHYVIECKHNKGKAWVFFTNDTHQKLYSDYLFWKTSDDSKSYNKRKKSSNLASSKTILNPFFYIENKEIGMALKKFQSKEKLHVSFIEVPFNKDRSPIHDAVSNTIKATEFFNTRYGADKIIHLFIPLIVTTSDLWSASLIGSKSTNKIRLKKTNFIIATHQTLKNEKYSKKILYFVVKENYLKTLLKNFRELGRKINSEWSKD